MMNQVYLDAAATAKYTNVDDIIVDTITQAMRDSWMNPSSLYAPNVRNKINRCRENIAKFINAKPEEIYFTSGASESNNWAIRGWYDANIYEYPHIITTPIEHKSILEIFPNCLDYSIVDFCDVNEYGLVDYKSLEDLLREAKNSPILVSICMANNEIGTVQHIELIAYLVHKYNGVLHVDATQAFGHIPIDVKKLGIDMMSCSGHKISPVLKGIGFLYKQNDIDIKPLIYGNQENGMRGGTENTFGIIGLNKAIEYCDVSNEKIEEMINKRDYFISQLESNFGCKLNGHSHFRLPNNINVMLPDGITGESVLYMLDIGNIKISTSSACNSKSIEPSHVLKAIGLSDEESMRSIRITLSNDITYKEIDYVIEEIDKVIKIIQGGEIDVSSI